MMNLKENDSFFFLSPRPLGVKYSLGSGLILKTQKYPGDFYVMITVFDPSYALLAVGSEVTRRQ